MVRNDNMAKMSLHERNGALDQIAASLVGVSEISRESLQLELAKLAREDRKYIESTFSRVGAIAIVALAGMLSFVGFRYVELNHRVEAVEPSIVAGEFGGVSSIDTLVELGGLTVGEGSYVAMLDKATRSVRVFRPDRRAQSWDKTTKGSFSDDVCMRIDQQLLPAARGLGVESINDVVGAGYGGAAEANGDVVLCKS